MIGSDARTDAAELLRRCQMPEDEIRWVLTADDPAVIHMIVELHRERLEEELAERRLALGGLEMWLTEPAYREGSAPGTRMTSPAAVAARDRRAS